MKIGIIGPIWLDIPPKRYGGTEEVIYNLANGLYEKGHDVTLFGPKTSKIKSKLIPTVDKPLKELNVDSNNNAYTLYHLTEAFDRASEFDILHMHVNRNMDYMGFPFALCSDTPVLSTLHFTMPVDESLKDRYRVLMKYNKLPLTSISDAQRDNLDLNFIQTVYNSLDFEGFDFCEKPDDYFVWIGKVKPVKGTKEAIIAAKKAGVKLKLLGPIDRGVPEYLEYYEKEIKPMVDNKKIIWLGEVDTNKKIEVLRRAKAFLSPIQWEEPFGLVMAESQAVGTPVIVFNRGSAPELVVDGKTGFLVETIEEMVEKIKDVGYIDRKTCRQNIEEKFSIERMIEGYETAYGKTVSNWITYKESQLKEIKKRIK